MKNYLCFGGLFKLGYIYIDTEDYLADSLFYKHKVHVDFRGEYVKEDEPYIIVTCKIKKKDKERFEKALSEIENKMALYGHNDYGEWSNALITGIEAID